MAPMASPAAKATMPTSGPGSRLATARRRRGFTLIELLVVITLIALSAALVSLALRDGESTRLERDAERLATLLEVARAQSRATGMAVHWVAESGGASFRFVGLPGATPLPTAWLDADVRAQTQSATVLTLGPEALIGAQQVRLQLGARQLTLATDGLGPFAVVESASSP